MCIYEKKEKSNKYRKTNKTKKHDMLNSNTYYLHSQVSEENEMHN
jgi:hypothetical protein